MPYLVMDLEMTGNDPGWHEIIQIGALLFEDDWKEKGTKAPLFYVIPPGPASSC